MFSSKAREFSKEGAGGNLLPRNRAEELPETGEMRAGWLAAAAIPALFALSCLGRDKDSFFSGVPPPPPEPNPFVIEVPRGAPVWIPLSAYSLTSPIIRYRIWRKPAAGQIGRPQMTTADTAAVKYTPPAGAGPGEDSFAYEVQSEAGVSAPAEVRIKITDRDPVLITPAELDFGGVLPGHSARQLLEVQNIGGGVAEGEVQVPEGWTVEGDPSYRLGAGAKQTYTIVFAPTEERQYLGDVDYTGDPGRATDLKGTGLAPIALTSGTLELLGAGNVRMGAVQVLNRTDKPLAVAVTADPSLKVPSSLTVPAGGTADLPVQTREGEVGEIYGWVAVEGAGAKLATAVHAAGVHEALQAGPVSPAAGAPGVRTAQAAGASAAASTPAPGAVADSTPRTGSVPEAAMPALAAEVEETAGPGPRLPVYPLQVDDVGKDSARVSCDFKRALPTHAWRLEAQTVEITTQGRPRARWVPLPETPEVSGSTVRAALGHLQPGTLYLVRLVGLDGEGGIVALSSPAQIWIAVAREERHWGWIGLGAAALAGVAAWRWHRTATR